MIFGIDNGHEMKTSDLVPKLGLFELMTLNKVSETTTQNLCMEPWILTRNVIIVRRNGLAWTNIKALSLVKRLNRGPKALNNSHEG